MPQIASNGYQSVSDQDDPDALPSDLEAFGSFSIGWLCIRKKARHPLWTRV
jgi:hypothetical protein